MPLSEDEQRLLSQMEEQLLSDDPRFASAMRGSTGTRQTGLKLAVGIGGTVMGLGLLLLAVSQHQYWLGVIAFLVMVGAVVYAFAGPLRGQRNLSVVDPSGATRPARKAERSSRGGFVNRMEERWQSRRDRGDF